MMAAFFTIEIRFLVCLAFILTLATLQEHNIMPLKFLRLFENSICEYRISLPLLPPFSSSSYALLTPFKVHDSYPTLFSL